MKITISKTVKITSLEQWFNCAPPKGGAIQWKPGRSAQEMARFALRMTKKGVVDDDDWRQFIRYIKTKEKKDND